VQRELPCGIGEIVIRIVSATVLALAAGVLVPFAAGGKPEYTASCSAATHDVTLAWPGGTDVTATTGRLIWTNAPDEPVSLALPKQGGVSTFTWHNLGMRTGPLLGVEVQFLRKNSYSPPLVGVFCGP
jgi:hypothetical protein